MLSYYVFALSYQHQQYIEERKIKKEIHVYITISNHKKCMSPMFITCAEAEAAECVRARSWREAIRNGASVS